MAGATSVGRAQDQNINGLLSGVRWDAASLTFGFPSDPAAYGTGYGSGEPGNNFAPLNEAQQTAARLALAMVAEVCNLTFTELAGAEAGAADLRFARSDAPATAWAYLPADDPQAGDSWYRIEGGAYDAPAPGNYAFHTFIHEIGHALGLAHGHTGGGFGPMRPAWDSMEFSVMTYRSYVGGPAGYSNPTWDYAQTLMAYDIAALQHLYGANHATRAGDTVYRWDPLTGEMSLDGVGQGAPGGNKVFLSVWDGGGNDTFDLSASSARTRIDLRPGGWTATSQVQLAELGYDKIARGNVATALLPDGDPRGLIENAIGGSGRDVLIGNQAANRLDGGEGRDTAVLAGSRDDYAFAGTAASFTALRDGVADLLLGIETVRFSGSGKTYSVEALLAGLRDIERDTIADASLPFGRLEVGRRAVVSSVDAVGDHDLFRVLLRAGETYRFEVAGQPDHEGVAASPALLLRDSAGAVLAQAGTEGDPLRYAATVTGWHVLDLFALDGGTGGYVVAAREEDDVRDAVDDRTGPLGPLRLGEARTAGVLEHAGDLDVFRVTLAGGKLYRFEVSGRDGGGGTAEDPHLRVYDPSGFLLDARDDGGAGRDAASRVYAFASGRYHVEVGSEGRGPGSYTVRAVEVDDFRDGVGDRARPLGRFQPDGPAQAGEVEVAFDRDLFAVRLRAGETYAVEVRGSGSAAGTLTDPHVGLLDATGRLLGFDADGGEGVDARLVFTAAETATHYVWVYDHYNGSGTYLASVSRLASPAGTAADLA